MKKREKTFFDEEDRLRRLATQGDPLLKLKARVDWGIFRDILEEAFKREHGAQGGRPPYDYLMMFKILILQRYYHLSDEQMEFQINDRLSFNRFLGIGLEDVVPDRTTIWNFREHLTNKGIVKELFKRLTTELMKKRMHVKKGVMVDASFVDVPKQRNSREENTTITEGNTPTAWTKHAAKIAQKDVDARWATKNKETHYGYKNHIKANVQTKVIETYCVSPASTHDSQAINTLIDDDTDKRRTLFADSAYAGAPIAKILAKKEITSKIHEKGYRNHPLTEHQKAHNKKKSKARVRVEHIFGFIHNSMGGSYIRSIGMRRAETNIGLMNITYNIFRLMQLQAIQLRRTG